MSHERSVTHPLAGAARYRFEAPASRAPVTLLDGWEADHLERVRVPQLAGKPWRRPGSGTNWAAEMEPDPWVSFHRSAAAQLQAAFAEVEAEGLLEHVLCFGGAYEARLRTVNGEQSTVNGPDEAPEAEGGYTTELSAHALGLAVDLNPVENPLGHDGCRFGLTGGLRELAPLFERHGFRWGGYDRPCNASHFEVTRFLPAGETLPVRALLVRDGEPWCGLAAVLDGEHYWAEAAPVAKKLGGGAEVDAPRAPGTHPVAVSGPAGQATLDGRWHGSVMLVRLGELLELFSLRADPQPGREKVNLVAGA